MKPLIFTLLGSVLCATVGAAPPTERAPAAVAVDADSMDYRPLGVPALAKTGGTLKPPLNGAVFHPITVEMHAEVRADGTAQIVCDGGHGDDHDHGAHGHRLDDHAGQEPAR
jgi:hypothetical protein